MADFLKFISTYEALIYIVLAIGALFSFRWLYRSWTEWRVAVFSLEREFSSRRLSRSALISALIVVMFCGEFFAASFLIPGLPADFFLTTPTLDLISTPTGTLSPELLTQIANQPQVAQPNAAGCTPGQIELSFPEAGHEIKGVIELTGTVNIPNFGFYKYEVAPNGSDTQSATQGVDKHAPDDRQEGAESRLTNLPGSYR